MRTVITGGTISTGDATYAGDVLVEDGSIRAVGVSLKEASADRVIDATGSHVIPGCVDPHTHFDSPYAGVTTCDDFASGSEAAAAGGTTTVIDFALQLPGEGIYAAFAEWRRRVERSGSLVDYGFHMTLTDLTVGQAGRDLARLVDEGVTSFKFYMAPRGPIHADDETLFRGMRLASELGAMVMVHAENSDVIAVLMEDALRHGNTLPIWHAYTRPPESEGEAASRAIKLAAIANAPLYIVHISCREAAVAVEGARRLGHAVWGETCTQYLYIEEEALARDGREGGKYVFTPPPRPPEQIDALWEAVARGVLSVVATDHCPYFERQKCDEPATFAEIPGGVMGVEERLTLMYQGVRAGRISMDVLVRALARNPAQLFGLYPAKGAIAPGSDADIVVFDPTVEKTISVATQRSRVDYNIYEGLEVIGGPTTVLVRGEPVVSDGEVVGSHGYGRFVRRARTGTLQQMREAYVDR